MSELVERLRAYQWHFHELDDPTTERSAAPWEAADRIEALEGEINGTDPLAGDPTKWGLRAMLKGACGQRDDALKRIEALEADMRYILNERTHLWQIKETAERALGRKQ